MITTLMKFGSITYGQLFKTILLVLLVITAIVLVSVLVPSSSHQWFQFCLFYANIIFLETNELLLKRNETINWQILNKKYR